MSKNSQESEHNPQAYDAVFARLEAKIDNIALHIVELKTASTKLNERVIALEGFKSYALGVTAVVAASVTYYISRIFNSDK